MAAYFIFHNIIHDVEKMQEYIPKAVATLEPFGAKLLSLDEQPEIVEGDTKFPRMVIIEFETRELAKRWYNSPEYQQICQLRLDATDGFSLLVDGFQHPKSGR